MIGRGGACRSSPALAFNVNTAADGCGHEKTKTKPQQPHCPAQSAEGNDQPAPTNITVNNNTLSLAGSPPKPESVEEWQSWYEKNERAKLEAAKEPKDIDVSPV